MAQVFFTSDLHFGHNSLCTGLRGMTSDESDKLIITNWNNVVKKQDKVYILGDITMEEKRFLPLLERLNGTKVIVGGNHDTEQTCRLMAKSGLTVVGSINYKGYIVSHIPIHPLEVNYYKGNIHGHIHLKGNIEGVGNYEGIPLSNRYYNVNTEFHNYTPIPFAKIDKFFKEQGDFFNIRLAQALSQNIKAEIYRHIDKPLNKGTKNEIIRSVTKKLNRFIDSLY